MNEKNRNKTNSIGKKVVLLIAGIVIVIIISLLFTNGLFSAIVVAEENTVENKQNQGINLQVAKIPIIESTPVKQECIDDNTVNVTYVTKKQNSHKYLTVIGNISDLKCELRKASIKYTKDFIRDAENKGLKVLNEYFTNSNGKVIVAINECVSEKKWDELKSLTDVLNKTRNCGSLVLTSLQRHKISISPNQKRYQDLYANSLTNPKATVNLLRFLKVDVVIPHLSSD